MIDLGERDTTTLKHDPGMLGKWARRLAGLLLLAYAGFLVFGIAADEAAYQPDFRVYYCAARAWAEGLNPYDSDSISRVAQVPAGHPYVYPVLALVPFKFISPLSYHAAYRLFLLTKCLILVLILSLWRSVLRPSHGVVFYAFCLLAFNASLYLDFRAGNVSVLEQGALWLSFLFFARGNLFPFCLLVLLGSSFKITPLLFLLLLWSTSHRKRHWYFFGSVGGFLALHGVPFLLDTRLFPAFVRNVGQFDEMGIVNPSTATLLNSLSTLVAGTTGYEMPPAARWSLFAGIVIAVVVASSRAYVAARSLPHDEQAWQTVFLACFVYALILPRFKDYSFILLLAPAFSVIKRASPASAQIPLVVLAVLSAHYVHLPLLREVLDVVWDYYPLALAYLFWGMQVRELVSRHPPTSREAANVENAVRPECEPGLLSWPKTVARGADRPGNGTRRVLR